jgi:hypothetical protein
MKPEKEDITVRELLKRYPGRGYIVWYDDLWLLNCAKLRPLSKWEDDILDYKVKYYDDRVFGENDPLSINVK